MEKYRIQLEWTFISVDVIGQCEQAPDIWRSSGARDVAILIPPTMPKLLSLFLFSTQTSLNLNCMESLVRLAATARQG
jgi:hypothetical protein